MNTIFLNISSLYFLLRFILNIFSILIFNVSYSNAQFDPNKPYILAPPSGLVIISDFEVRIEGEIDEGLFIQVENFFKSNRRENINFHLNSKGGNIYHAMKIGRLMREHDVYTVVDMDCYSSCFLLYISGVSRKVKTIFGKKYADNVYGNVGLHRPYYNIKNPQDLVVKSDYDKMLNDLKKYFLEMNISLNVYDIMINTSPEKFELYNSNIHSNNYIEKIVQKNDPYYDEKVVFMKSIFYKISTIDVRSRENKISNECNFITGVKSCHDSIMYNISYKQANDRGLIRDIKCLKSKIYSENEIEELFINKTRSERFADPLYKKMIDCHYLTMTNDFKH